MNQPSWVLVILTGIIWLSPVPGSCQNRSRILIIPVDGSHWLNMEILLKELHARGHNLTVMRSDNSWYIPEKSPLYTTISMKSLQDDVDLDFYNEMLRQNLEYRRMGSFLGTVYQQWDFAKMFASGHALFAEVIMSMFENQTYMEQLKKENYDLIFTDPGLPTGIFFAHYLKKPMVFNVRWINTGDCHFSFAPSPLSYVPMVGSELHDRMTFMERIKNVLLYLNSAFQQHLVINPSYRELLDRYFPPGTTLMSMQNAADLWLVRAEFVFELPRPTMPNVVYIGGFQSKPSKPLPADLEEFVQASGEHGVVVMSLGSLISALPKEITDSIASAFAELPQKVIWRYLGEKPSTLGNNTLLVQWLPQNDLLGHPKTRAFVAHGGTNGLYEAIYHGVPVLGLPLLFDQYDNILRLKVRGAAQMLEVASLTKNEFLEALKDLLENNTYSENMLKLSHLHKDTPVTPLESAVFWIEYVIRHKGASHLRTEAYNMPWYVYYGLDAALLLLAILAGSVWVSFSLCKVLYLRFSAGKRKKE